MGGDGRASTKESKTKPQECTGEAPGCGESGECRVEALLGESVEEGRGLGGSRWNTRPGDRRGEECPPDPVAEGTGRKQIPAGIQRPPCVP